MPTLSKLAAIYVASTGWDLSATGPQDTVACEVHSDHWRTPPRWNDPAALAAWALSVARSGETPPPATGRTFRFTHAQDEDSILRFALILSPTACAAFGTAQRPDPDQPHPWLEPMQAAGWKARTKTTGPWLTVERPGAEIGILMAGWLDTSKPRECAGHGIVVNRDRIDGWGTCFVHGEYRRLTGWPLSAGAGMAAVKGLWRSARTTRVTWTPKGAHKTSAQYWDTIPPVALGRAHRPWHLHWTAWPAFAEPLPEGRVALWDANADYLVAWAAARFARDALTHTGPDPVRPRSGRPAAGYYLIDSITWAPEAQYVADRLPPVWGSRTPNADGAVWVTHVVLDLLDSLTFGENGPAPTYRVLDSYTCASSGQLARTWGERLKAALLAARQEAARERSGPEDDTLAEALKQSYARGYPLLENSGIIVRPDHVDTLVDQRSLSAYKRMWSAAWEQKRYPLDVSADEITYLYRDQDEQHGPLGEPSDTAYGHYKIKRRGSLEEWHTSHQDGRSGLWWLPAPQKPVPPAQRPAPATDAPAGGDGGWLSAILGD